MTPYEKVQHCLAQVKKACPEKPKVGIVLGSGLGDLADAVEDAVYVPYAEIDGFPISTAPGHVGRFVFGSFEGLPVVLSLIHISEPTRRS